MFSFDVFVAGFAGPGHVSVHQAHTNSLGVSFNTGAKLRGLSMAICHGTILVIRVALRLRRSLLFLN
jgi:hypothetical protein